MYKGRSRVNYKVLEVQLSAKFIDDLKLFCAPVGHVRFLNSNTGYLREIFIRPQSYSLDLDKSSVSSNI